MRVKREHEVNLGERKGRKRHLCPLPHECRGERGRGKGEGRGRQIWKQVQESRQRKSELHRVSAAKMGQEGARGPHLSPHLTAMARSRLGPQQARLGQVPVSPGHRWLRGQGARAQREGKKWQLPQPSLHPAAWTEGRMALVLVCQGALRPGSHTHPGAQHIFSGPSLPANG